MFLSFITVSENIILQYLSVSIFSYWTVNFLFPGVNLTPGQKVTAVILHIDILSTCVHVSALYKLLGKKKSVSITFLNAIFLFQNNDNV